MKTRIHKQRCKIANESTAAELTYIRASYRNGHASYEINKEFLTHGLMRVLRYWGIEYTLKLKVHKVPRNRVDVVFNKYDPSSYIERTSIILIFAP